MSRLLVSFLLCLPAAFGHQAPGEEEAYTKLVQARDLSRSGNGQAARRFGLLARAFLESHPMSPRCDTVRGWLKDLAFRFEAPPPLAVDRWIGRPVDPRRNDGQVKMLVFFSDTHPQTAKVLPRVVALRGRRPVELIGVAAVGDDYASQRPDVLARRIAARRLPFSVAIDEQRPKQRSVSLERYRGGAVPWIVILDRYGRVAWFGGVSVRSVGRIERKLDELLGQPTYAQLRSRVLKGDRRALDALAGIRTVTTASILVDVSGKQQAALRSVALAVLKDLLPKGLSLGDALRRWASLKQGVRFSFPQNRLVRRR